MRVSALAVIVATAWSTLAMPVAAQWIRFPTAAVPRTRDGKPDLAARTPRAADGKPDLSGVWQNDGYGPPGGEGLGATPKTVFFDLVHGMNGAPPFQPWAATLAGQRRHDEAKDNPDARCLPLGPLQMLAHPLPKKILQSRGLVVILHERNMEFRQIFTDGRGCLRIRSHPGMAIRPDAGTGTRWWWKRLDCATGCGPISTEAR